MNLKFLSWNVEHFRGQPMRLQRIAQLVKDEDPDVFALLEVEGKTVFSELVARFPGYSFTITEGRQVQEILLAWRGGLSAFMTQRNEFKRSNPSLRPSALLTITPDSGKQLSLLVAHLKSFPSPEGFGLRDAMISKVRDLKKAIDRAVGVDQARFILVGDLNTMGLNLSFSKNDLSGEDEIARLKKVLKGRGLVRKVPTHPHTWNNGSNSTYLPAALDHVFATENLDFKDQGGGASVLVGGWAQELSVAGKDKWIEDFSDHAPLIFEVQGL